MNPPQRTFLTALLLLALPCGLSAQAVPQEPANDSSTAPSGRKRIISGETAAALAASRPKYDPPAPAEKAPDEEPADLRETDKPRNGIIRLPKYVVQEPKPPVFSERDLHSRDELAGLGMKRNPGLKYVPFPSLNRGIGLMMYREQERLQNMADLKDEARSATRTGDTDTSDYLKRESDRTYLRSSGFGTAWER